MADTRYPKWFIPGKRPFNILYSNKIYVILPPHKRFSRPSRPCPTAFANRDPKGHVAAVRGVDLSRARSNRPKKTGSLQPVDMTPMANETTFENLQRNHNKP